MMFSLTNFLADGKFIFQLAAHHQQHPYNNQTALTSPCRWIPVPTVIQQHKNNVKSIGEWSQHHKNKTIWPYLVTNPTSDSKSLQAIQQSQLPIVKVGERKSQQYQPRIETPPLKSNDGAVNIAAHTGAVVMATTTNIVRRPSRKCSTTTAVENALDKHHRQLQSHLQPLSKRLQQHQHQSFMMVATKMVKAQRRLLSIPRMKRRQCRKTKIAMDKDSLLQEKEQQPLINLECVVRNLWCRRHTTELLLRRQLSLNNNIDAGAATDIPSASRIVAVTIIESTSCTTTGNSKRRSVFSPLSTITTPATTSMTNSIINITGNDSPHKKYRLGEQQVLQQQRVVDKCVKKTVSTSLPQSQIISTNDHSITAILSSGAVGAKRPNGCGTTTVVDTEISVISSSSSNTIIPPQKNHPAPVSLLRTLLKSPNSESNALPVVASTTSSNYRHNTSSSRKRSAIESTIPIVTTPVVTTVETGPRTTAMAIPPTTGLVNDAALHQIPSLHHPTTAGQLAAAGYFNVLYHQAAMAAAMAYQTHAQLPKSSLLSSQYPHTVDASNSWQHQFNRPPLLPPLKTIGGNGIASVSSSASTIVAPYSSPLVTAAVNGSGLLAPATPSPPPLLLHPHSVHHHQMLLHHQQQYQQIPTMQQSSYHQHKRQQGSSSNGIKKKTMVTMGAIKYDSNTGGNNLADVAAIDEESSSSTGEYLIFFVSLFKLFNLFNNNILFAL